MRKPFTPFPSILPVILLAFCAPASMAQNATPVLTGRIVESQLVTLEGNTPPAALRAENDRGPVADSMQFDHMLLVLKGTSESEAALRKLIDGMHAPAAAAGKHQWLTPQQIGTQFGLARQDLDTIQRWLESHGFSVNRGYWNGLIIVFSGWARPAADAPL